MKKNICVFLSLILLLVACSRSKPKESTLDNSSYYNSIIHNVAESENGYYCLYGGILCFVEKETGKYYLISKEKYSLGQLLENSEIREKSDAYFGEQANVFYDGGNLYVGAEKGLYKLNPQAGSSDLVLKNNTQGGKQLIKNSLYIYEESKIVGGELNSIIHLYDFQKKKEESLFSTKDIYPDKETHVQAMYLEGSKLIFRNSVVDPKSSQFEDSLMIYDLENKNHNIISFGQKKDIINFFVKDKDLYFSTVERNDKIYWLDKKVVYYKTGLDKIEFSEYKTIDMPNYIFSNGNLEVEASGSAISLLIAQDSLDLGGRKIDFEIKYKDKTLVVPKELYSKRNSIGVVVNSQGLPVLVYDDGRIILMDKDGSFKAVFDGK